MTGPIPLSIAFLALLSVSGLVFGSTLSKRRSWFIPINVLAGLAVAVLLCARFLPKLYGRLGPYAGHNSFPNAGTAFAVAFYGFILALACRYKKGWLTKAGAALLALLVSIAAAFYDAYTGYAWFTDLLGGALLGLALVFTAYLILSQLESRQAG